MKYYITILTLVLAFFVTTNSQVQTKTIGEFSFQHHQISDVNVQLTDASLQLVKENTSIYLNLIEGKKTFDTSPDNKFFFITNFAFIDEDGDYPVTLFVFNENGELYYSHEVLAPFDLPHPLFAVNNEGVLAYFEPLSFTLTIVKEEMINPIKLEESIEFEMEKSFFISFNDSGVYLLTTIGQTDIEGRNNFNTYFYYINYPFNNVTKRIINFSVPTALSVFEEEVIISGIRFENMQPFMETQLYSNDVELKLTINGFSYQQIIKTAEGYAASYAGKLFYMDNNFNEKFSFIIGDTGIIRNVEQFSDFIAVLFHNNQEDMIYLFDKNLNKVHEHLITGFTGKSTLSMHKNNNMLKIVSDYKTKLISLSE